MKQLHMDTNKYTGRVIDSLYILYIKKNIYHVLYE